MKSYKNLKISYSILRYLGEVDEAIFNCLRRAFEQLKQGQLELVFSGLTGGLYFAVACDYVITVSVPPLAETAVIVGLDSDTDPDVI